MPREDEDLIRGVLMPDDFPYLELIELAESLSRMDVFVPGYIPPLCGMYHPDGFIYEHEIEGNKTVLLPDRNVTSRFAQIAAGETLDNNKQRQVACSIMAFCQCLDIEIEPSISFHELAQKESNEVAWAELRLFRVADNGNPFEWVDLALNRRGGLKEEDANFKESKLDLEFPLRRWNRNYIVTLKIAELEITQKKGTHLERLMLLIDWMYSDFMLADPAALLAAIYFAPNSPPRKGLIKNLRSSDRERAVLGVKNAAWDLTYLSDFALRVTEGAGTGSRYVFASFDVNLKNIAKMIFGYSTVMEQKEELVAVLREWWVPGDAVEIANRLLSFADHADDLKWLAKKPKSSTYVQDFIQEGESRLRCWTP